MTNSEASAVLLHLAYAYEDVRLRDADRQPLHLACAMRTLLPEDFAALEEAVEVAPTTGHGDLLTHSEPYSPIRRMLGWFTGGNSRTRDNPASYLVSCIKGMHQDEYEVLAAACATERAKRTPVVVE